MSSRKYFLSPGQKLFSWTLIQRVPDKPGCSVNMRHRWRVECECGKRQTLPQYYLTRKTPKEHCGCKHKTLRTIHKDAYSCWQMMRVRCNDSKHVSYRHYGGRGIKVCTEWDNLETGFEAFLEHMGPRPSPGHSIDRIDNNIGYFPGNVRWATAKQQRANQRPRNEAA